MAACEAEFETSKGVLRCTRRQAQKRGHELHEWRQRLPGKDGREAALMVTWWDDTAVQEGR